MTFNSKHSFAAKFAYTAIIQILGLGICIISINIPFAIFWVVIFQVCFIVVTAWLAQLSKIWVSVNACLGPAILFCLMLSAPAWPFALITLFLLGIFAPALRAQVPYFPTHPAIFSLVANELPPDREFTFIDLGCGSGALLRYLEKRFPNGSFVGVELSVVAVGLAYAIGLVKRSQVQIKRGDFWKMSLQPYDFVYTFLSPEPMPKLFSKAITEMRDGSILLSNSFKCSTEAKRQIVTDETNQMLFVYPITH